ncbi:MAG: hypothetical protein WC365_01935 [Candidatus Babeliales bacterium]
MINCKSVRIYILFLVFPFSNMQGKSDEYFHAITYKPCGTRLGDRVYLYSLTKWLSYKYKIPFLFIPFEYSNFFDLTNRQKILNADLSRCFKCTIGIKSEKELSSHLKQQKQPTLFEVDFFSSICLPAELKELSKITKYEVGINWIYFFKFLYPEYGEELKKDLKVLSDFPSLAFPSGFITVAVHVRKGGGFDAPQTYVQYLDEYHGKYVDTNITKKGHRGNPIKFPPEQYYVDQIVKLSTMLNDAPLFVYVFTDDKRPDLVVERLKKESIILI